MALLMGLPSQVVLVEAAGQLGGRVKTHPSLCNEYPVELGAEFVHGPDNALMDLVRRATLARCVTLLIAPLSHSQVKRYGLTVEHIFTWAQGDGGPSDEAVRGGVGTPSDHCSESVPHANALCAGDGYR